MGMENKTETNKQPLLIQGNFRRQLGAEKNTNPLSCVHDTPSDFAITYSRIAIVLTIVFWLMYITSVIIKQLIDGPQSYNFTIEVFSYSLIVTFLTLSALMYLITRQGALQNFKKHVRTPQRLLDEHFSKHKSSITVLVPSYSEEVQVIRKTLLSAALQEHSDLRVVLLLDDNPFKVKPEDVERIEKTKALGAEIEAFLSEPYNKSIELHTELQAKGFIYTREAIQKIIAQYNWSAEWLEKKAQEEILEDHVDVFFAEQIFIGLAKDLRTAATELESIHLEGEKLSKSRMEQVCNRLVWIFRAKLDLFERKRYISLSHELNKAMNLNSYIGLMGGMYRKVRATEGTILMKTKKESEADIIIPDSDFILTLDADSILLREYCSRLVYLLQQPNNADVAVVQTPYSSFRGASTRLERLSGATTDIQHIIHQGMSYYNATFWVGANAVIRKKALEEIVQTEFVGGFEIKRFVQDHTVIEDTESSIDMALQNWRLVNYPERLSYSATPPDFGSLVVQRLRWANGGLLIFPKLLKLCHIRKHEGRPISKMEFFIRANYMVSIAWSSLGLVLLLAYPYDGRLLSPLVLLAAAPYFIAMAMDLKYCRYNYTDIFRIYGFNLILLPVNIAGTLKSLQQAITTKKIPFARTPKVKNRTATAWLYLVSPLLIIGFSLFTLWRNIEGENWGNAAFAGFNAFAATWAVVAYIGVKNMMMDLWAALIDWLYIEVPVKEERPKTLWRFPSLNLQKVILNKTN